MRCVCPPWVMSYLSRSRLIALCLLTLGGLLNASPSLDPNAESLPESLTYFAVGVDRTGRWAPVSQSLQAGLPEGTASYHLYRFCLTSSPAYTHNSVPTGAMESSEDTKPSQAISVLRGISPTGMKKPSGPFPCSHTCLHG